MSQMPLPPPEHLHATLIHLTQQLTLLSHQRDMLTRQRDVLIEQRIEDRLRWDSEKSGWDRTAEALIANAASVVGGGRKNEVRTPSTSVPLSLRLRASLTLSAAFRILFVQSSQF